MSSVGLLTTMRYLDKWLTPAVKIMNLIRIKVA